jgi:transposase
VQQVLWTRSGSGFTLLFEAFTMLLIQSEMPVYKAAKLVKVYPHRIWNIFHFWISKMHSEDEINDLTCLDFDETSSKRGHKYVTLAVDMDKRRVLFATEGKGADTIEKTVDYLHSKQVEISDIKNVCIDMSLAFISSCQKHLTDAAITFDRFHVVKEVNKAMDQLRRDQRRPSFELKGHNYTKSKINNGMLEGINSKVQLAKKRNRGY